MLNSSIAPGGEDLWLCATTSREAKVDEGMEFQLHGLHVPPFPPLPTSFPVAHILELVPPSHPMAHICCGSVERKRTLGYTTYQHLFSKLILGINN